MLPVLLAALHVRLDTGAKDRLRTVEVYLIYLFMLGVAAGGLSGFFGHVFTPETVAESIGWPKGNPFQQEMGFANLALGVLGFIAAGRRDGFREATVIAVAIVGVGATVVHVIDMVQEGNLAPGNSIQNIGNLLKPALLIPMLIVSRRSEPAEAGDASFDRWRSAGLGTAGVVTAVVGDWLRDRFLARPCRAGDAGRSCPGGGHRRAVGEHPEDCQGACSASTPVVRRRSWPSGGGRTHHARGVIGHVRVDPKRRPHVALVVLTLGQLYSLSVFGTYGSRLNRCAMQLRRARRLSSAGTTNHGASGMSVCTNISSFARE